MRGAVVVRVAQVGVERPALAAARVAELRVARRDRVVRRGVDVADGRVHRPAELLGALGHPLVRAVEVRALGVRAHPGEDGLEVAVELLGVDVGQPVLGRPLAAHLGAGLHAVVPVDRRAAAEGRAGEQADVAVGAHGQPVAVHHRRARLDLELAVVALAGRAAGLQDDDLPALQRQDARDGAAARAGADDDDVGLQDLAVGGDVRGDVRRVRRRRDDRAGVAVLRPEGVATLLVDERVRQHAGPAAQRRDRDARLGSERHHRAEHALARAASLVLEAQLRQAVEQLRDAGLVGLGQRREELREALVRAHLRPGRAQNPCGSSPSGAGRDGTAVSTRARRTSRCTGFSSATRFAPGGSAV